MGKTDAATDLARRESAGSLRFFSADSARGRLRKRFLWARWRLLLRTGKNGVYGAGVATVPRARMTARLFSLKR